MRIEKFEYLTNGMADKKCSRGKQNKNDFVLIYWLSEGEGTDVLRVVRDVMLGRVWPKS